MKKLLAVFALLVSMAIVSNAQEIGVRFGNVSGGNVAIDGVFGLGKFERIHADVSFGKGVGIDALWDFIYKPLGSEEFSWYAGAGPFVRIASPFWFGAVGELGLEYKIKNFPMAIGVDWRPSLSIVKTTDFYADRFGLNIRYIIGKK